MNSLAKEEFEQKYYTGRLAFEKGQYRLSIEKLESATQLVPGGTRLGGEVKIWLVSAYQAAGQEEKAIALCQELCSHPHGETKRQAQRLLYIIQAPQLKRPKEWMTEIPELNSTASSKIKKYHRPSNPRKIKPKRQIELVDLSQVNTDDNRFIWLGIFLVLVLMGGLFLA